MALLADPLPVNPVPMERGGLRPKSLPPLNGTGCGRGRPRSSRFGSWSRCAALLVLFLALGFAALGATLEPPKSEAEVKADYLLLFSKYIDWPPEAFVDAKQPFVIGVIGDDAVGEALERRVKGRTTQGGRKVTILRARRPEDLAGCKLLFVGPAERRSLIELAGAARSKSTLTVCDTEAIFSQGAMIKFVLVQATVRFEVKLGPVELAGLSIHSGMLGSAKQVWPKPATSPGAP